MGIPVLELQRVSFAYPGDDYIITDSSYQVTKNTLVILRGKSGSGKTTVLKLFNRFCEPGSGQILFQGKPLHDYEIERLRSSVIYLPQMPYIIEGTIEDNLKFPFLFLSNKNKVYDEKLAGQWMEYFQLEMPLSRDAAKLSLGQKQRVALIRSILPGPDVLLLDEPCSALDRSSRLLIEQKICHLLDKTDITILMASHSDILLKGMQFNTLYIQNKSFSYNQV